MGNAYTEVKKITLTNETYFRVIRGIKGKRSRMLEFINCDTEDQVKQLSWLDKCAFGRSVPVSQMGTGDLEMNITAKSISWERYSYAAWTTTDIGDELDCRNINTTDGAYSTCYTGYGNDVSTNSLKFDEKTKALLTADNVDKYAFFPYPNYGSYSFRDLTSSIKVMKCNDTGDLFITLCWDEWSPAVVIKYKDGTYSNGIRVGFAGIGTGNQLSMQMHCVLKYGTRIISDADTSIYWLYLMNAAGNINGNQGDVLFNTNYDITFNFWIFGCQNEAIAYLNDGDYKTALNYNEPTVKDFDFYYRARYGAEFPWDLDDDPPIDPEIGTLIDSTKAEANSQGSGSQNLEAKVGSKMYDTVNMSALVVGMKYKLKGKAYNVTDKKYISDETKKDDDGKVTSETKCNPTIEFTATSETQSVSLEYLIDASSLEGKILVLFAYLYGQDAEGQPDHFVTQHEKINDEAEQIKIVEPEPDPPWTDDDDESGNYPVDKDFNILGNLDFFESLVWTDRYYKAGDFQVYAPVNANIISTLKIDNYFMIPESDHCMIVEKIEIKSDPDEGDKLCLSGRSLESILDRRVIWKKTAFKDAVMEDVIGQLLTENVMGDNIGRRRIEGFTFENSNDSEIRKIKIDAEYMGDNLYDVICDLCSTYHIGFKVTLTSDNKFKFKLYRGKDRTTSNTVGNVGIIFAAELDNVINSNLVINKEPHKNVIRVSGDEDNGEEGLPILTSVHSSDFSGLTRRETYISASDLDKTEYEELDDGREKYLKAMRKQGQKELDKYYKISAADGEMNMDKYTYDPEDAADGKYYLGDKIEYFHYVANNVYEEMTDMRITEVTITKDTDGTTIYPTFESIELNEDVWDDDDED